LVNSDSQPHPVLVSTRLPIAQLETLDDPLANQQELSADALVAIVLSRNRSLAAMQAAWRSTAARYPQAMSLDDPEFMSLMAPGSFSDPNFQSSFMVGASQKLPWPGKRGLRGEAVRADTAAAYMDANELAVRLESLTRSTFVEYYRARRQLALVDDNLQQLRQLRGLAQNKYEARSATQQDMLQADVDLAELARRRIELAQAEKIAVARLNTLAHRAPDMPLPPPPRAIEEPLSLPEAPLLWQAALAQRPDLAAAAARVRAEQVAVQIARKEYMPDFDVGGRYDQFWDRANQRGQLGINMNVPLYQQRRDAAVQEACFRLSQRRAEYDQAVDDIRNEVQAAYEQSEASRQIVDLYKRQVVPAAQQNVEAARAGYEANNLGFLSLVEAQRQLIDAQMKQVEALAEYHRRMAELQQATGGRLPLLPAEEVPSAIQNRTALRQ
jgi:outer membrane protein TolC